MNAFSRPLFTLALLTSAASAAPSTLTGEWYGGSVFPRSAYTLEGFRQAGSDTERLLPRPDGTYELATLSTSATPETFGWSGRLISCEKISIRWEAGRYTVQGGTLVLKPGAAKGFNLATPHSLKSGCVRSGGLSYTGTDLRPRTSTWRVTGTTLTLTTGKDRAVVRRATPEELRRASTPSPPPASPPVVVTPPPPPPPPPVRQGGSGRWAGRLTTDGNAPLDVRLNVEDDRLGIQGMVLSAEGEWLGTVAGDHRSGTLTLTLRLPDDTAVELRATGKFDGDTYTGRFQAVTADGQTLGGGQVNLTRAPARAAAVGEPPGPDRSERPLFQIWAVEATRENACQTCPRSPSLSPVTSGRASAPAFRAISGTATAAGGHSLKDTVIDSGQGKADFTLPDLDDVPSAICAVQDNDGDEDVSAEPAASTGVPSVRATSRAVRVGGVRFMVFSFAVWRVRTGGEMIGR
ncbi:hypothetical protein V3W47_19095 [Deinococcus sp. YIM 134068]|uniref:hypothetical protein n=1 Tax=Deinococcus lichenicola TaxID=3118910 RepID=UPI002F93DB11